MDGELGCRCGARFELSHGVPRFEVHEEADSRVWPWQRRANDDQWLLDQLAPLSTRDLVDAAIVELGAGAGERIAALASYGVRTAVALEPTADVDRAFRATRHLHNVHVVQGNLERPPLARVFDFAFSIGALAARPEPKLVFDSLIALTPDGGRIAAWLPSRENNEWLIRLLDPMRLFVTSKISPKRLVWLSLAPALLLRGTAWAYRVKPLANLLPFGAALAPMSGRSLTSFHRSVYHQLTHRKLHFPTRDEVERWLANNRLLHATIDWHNNTAWRVGALTSDSVRLTETLKEGA